MPLADPRLPTIAVITVNFNGRAHLDDCLQSLERMDYPRERWDVIMVDNASRDGSVAHVRDKFPWVKVLTNAENEGFAPAVNQAVRETDAEYLAFLNNDMHVDRGWLREAVAQLAGGRTDTVCVASKILNWDGTKIDFVGGSLSFYGHAFQESFGAGADGTDFDSPRELLFACGGAMVIERAVYEDLGGFDDDYFAFFEDVDLGWRLWVSGYSVMYAPKSVVYHRHHASASRVSDAKKHLLYERNALFTIIKNYEDDVLAKVLPGALALCAERGLLYGGVDKSKYYIKMPKVFEGGVQREHGVSVGRMKVLSGQVGKGVMVKRSLQKVLRLARGRLFRLLRIESLTETVLVPKVTLSPIVAIDEVVASLPALTEKRQAIQSRRKRSDAEIFRLFGDAFRPNLPTPEFELALERTVDFLQIRETIRADERSRNGRR